MMMTLKRIDVLAFAQVFCILHAVVGLFLGVGLAINASMNPDEDSLMNLGAWAIVIVPILNAVLGFLAGSFIAFCYNRCAQAMGGFKFELEET